MLKAPVFRATPNGSEFWLGHQPAVRLGKSAGLSCVSVSSLAKWNNTSNYHLGLVRGLNIIKFIEHFSQCLEYKCPEKMSSCNHSLPQNKPRLTS